MIQTGRRKVCLVGSAASVFILGGILVLAQDGLKPMGVSVLGPAPKGQPFGVGGPPSQSPGKLRTKVFRLAVCDPEEVRQILEGLLDDSATVSTTMPGVPGGPAGGGPLGVGTAPGALPGVPPGTPGVPGSGGVGFPGGGFGGGLGGGLGGFGGGFVAPPPWRVTIDARTRAMVVRGTERDLQIANDLVAIVEAPADKPLPAVKSLRAFRLQHAKADELQTVLEELELETRVVSAPAAKLLIASGSEEVLRELADIVKELDVEVKKSDKPTEPRKLLGGMDP